MAINHIWRDWPWQRDKMNDEDKVFFILMSIGQHQRGLAGKVRLRNPLLCPVCDEGSAPPMGKEHMQRILQKHNKVSEKAKELVYFNAERFRKVFQDFCDEERFNNDVNSIVEKLPVFLEGLSEDKFEKENMRKWCESSMSGSYEVQEKCPPNRQILM